MKNATSTESRAARADVYLRAAEKEDMDGWRSGACWAITGIVAPSVEMILEPGIDKNWPLPVRQFRELFNPSDDRIWWYLDDPDARVLALCFMAAMVEAGDA